MSVDTLPPQPEPSEERGGKVLRDPIHDLIYFGPEDRWFLDLIDTKEFQRLRRIRQLGVAHLVYPGAEHTRFTHSLGVFNFARRMIERLLDRHHNDDDIREQLTAKSQTIKVAALLHDVGHGPFSHVFERVFQTKSSSALKHDEWTCKILKDPNTRLHQVLRDSDRVNIGEVCSLISGDDDAHLDRYLKDIVSSQLDADRMDYLLRDSLMTGSRYGQFDSEWVLNAVAIGEPRLGEQTYRKLCLDASKGTGGIEGLLFARRLMLQHVYGHKTTRAYEAELIQTLRLAVELEPYLPEDTPSVVRTVLQERGAVSTNDYLMLDDDLMWWTLRRWATWNGHGAPDGVLADALKHHALRLVRR